MEEQNRGDLEPKSTKLKYAIGFTAFYLTTILIIGFTNGLTNLKLNELGDFFGGFLTPLALFWFVVTVFIQRDELELTRKVSSKMADAQTAQTEIELERISSSRIEEVINHPELRVGLVATAITNLKLKAQKQSERPVELPMTAGTNWTNAFPRCVPSTKMSKAFCRHASEVLGVISTWNSTGRPVHGELRRQLDEETWEEYGHIWSNFVGWVKDLEKDAERSGKIAQLDRWKSEHGVYDYLSAYPKLFRGVLD